VQSGADALGRTVYIAHAVPGLEQLALQEAGQRLGGIKPLGTLSGFDERTGLTLFRTSASVERLLELRTIEDLFALALDANAVHGGYSATKEIRALVAGDRGLDAAASRASVVRPKRRRKTTFRVVARMAGSHAFKRADLQRAVALAVTDRFPDWLEVKEDAQFEVWASLIEDRLILAVRLSDTSLRTRNYRATSLPGALKPTLAYAMALLSEPRPDDVVLDPMCGAGTLLIERAHAGRYARLIGGDLSEEAVRASVENAGPRFQPFGIARWDARRLPLPDGSTSVVLANMPFGKQFGSPESNRALYPALLDEWLRVLRPDGRMVLLTPEQRLIRQHAAQRGLALDRTLDVLVRGQPAAIHVLRRGQPGEPPPVTRSPVRRQRERAGAMGAVPGNRRADDRGNPARRP
jgi:tRNA (guanine6-N2)-methyltransferase